MEPNTFAAIKVTIQALKVLQDAWKGIRGIHRTLRAGTSVDHYQFIRSKQKEYRRHFAALAHQLPRNAAGRGPFWHAPLLAESHWIPSRPIQLPPPDEKLLDDGDQLITTHARESSLRFPVGVHQSTQVAARIAELLPSPRDGQPPFRDLHSAILTIDRPPPELFVSRPSYSLFSVREDAGSRLMLRFTRAHYFDYIDSGELLAYEFIREALELDQKGQSVDDLDYMWRLDKRLSLREALGPWNAVQTRPSLAGVNMLTVFVDTKSGASTFLIMERSPETGSASSTMHVIPAGEFQPTTDALSSWDEHCTLWQTIVREFAEEVLLDEEAKSHGMEMVALARRPPIAAQLRLIRAGHWRTYFLGVGLDPLTLKPEILLVSVIEKEPFIEEVAGLLPGRRLPAQNSEGKILVKSDGWGETLSWAGLSRYRDGPTTLPAASGCIELLERNATHVLGFALQ